MSLRVAIATVASRPFTLDESQLDGPDVLGGWTASGLLGDIVGAAALADVRSTFDLAQRLLTTLAG